MHLPEPLRVLRSAIASSIGLILRLIEPVMLRLRRFVFECWARAQLRGNIAPGVQFIGFISVDGEALVDIGPGTRVGSRAMMETYNGARIVIGPNVTINDGVTLCAYHGITIGEGTMIGEYSSIRDSNHGTRLDIPVRQQVHEGSPIAIGRDCWVGRGVAVLRGVTMHDGAIAAANSVVNRDLEAAVIAGGVPARPIGQRTSGESPDSAQP